MKLASLLFAVGLAGSPLASGAPVISEFLAQNNNGKRDQDGQTSDWIEIHNPGPEAVNLTGYSLTDDAADLRKWPFPAVELKPGAYLLVFASGKDRRDMGAELHANFNLDRAGEFLALVDAKGSAISSFSPTFSSQRADISFGLRPSLLGEYSYFKIPTPGAENAGEAMVGFVADTKFSVDRGFYEQPFDVAISCETAGAKIYYTLNGAEPSSIADQEYTAPIRVTTTTVLRARAFKDGWEPSDIDTQSYIFTSHVATQSAATATDRGFPARWKTQAADYEVDPDVVGPNDKFSGQYRATFADDLKAVPTLSLVMKVDDMFGERGIYSNPNNRGSAWERPTSLEFLYADRSKPNVQAGAGIQIQGGAFRDFSLTKKKSFRVVFKEGYGPGKFRFPLFDDRTAAKEFNTFTLRAENNDGWQWSGANNAPQYARDQFGRDCQRALGQPSSHGFHLHLYINGMYWGVYNIVERPDSGFAETYLGVKEEEWDGLKYDGPVNITGDNARSNRSKANWNKLVSLSRDVKNATEPKAKWAAFQKMLGLRPDGTDDPNEPSYLDLNNALDYFLLNHYLGNADWPHRNYYCGRDSSPQSEGFKFFMWDAEWSILLNSNTGSSIVSNNAGVQAPFVNLKDYEHFRVYMSDRIHKHVLTPAGALYVDPANPQWDPDHPERNVPGALYWRLTERIKRALVGESARWGDQHRATNPYTVNKEWVTERTRVMNSWFSKRSAQFVQNYKQVKLYPTGLDAPAISPMSGDVEVGTQVQFAQPSVGRIYYTLDGADPYWVNPETGLAEPGASAKVYNSPIPVEKTTVVKARIQSALDSGSFTWSPLQESVYTVGARKLVISEIMYHPAPATDQERAAGWNTSAFEYIELLNAGSGVADLSGVKLIDGVEYDFRGSAVKTLKAGERVRVVAHVAAHTARYGSKIPVAGVFAGTLQNDGERISLADANGFLVRDFVYDDKKPWPEEADGGGFALALKDAATMPDHAVATQWEARKIEAAAPSAGALAKWLADNGLTDPTDDKDGDRLPALLEFALGASPKQSDPWAGALNVSLGADRRAMFTHQRSLLATGVSLVIETSADLRTWTRADVVEQGKEALGADRERVTFRAQSATSGGALYARLKAQVIP